MHIISYFTSAFTSRQDDGLTVIAGVSEAALAHEVDLD